jgi:hypothetical protein
MVKIQEAENQIVTDYEAWPSTVRTKNPRMWRRITLSTLFHFGLTWAGRV